MNTEHNSEEPTAERATIAELAIHYNRDKTTIRRWIKPIQSELGKRIGHTFSKEQVSKIHKFIGTPIFLVAIYKRLDQWMDDRIVRIDLTEKYFHYLNTHDLNSQPIRTYANGDANANGNSTQQLSQMQIFFTAHSDFAEITEESAMQICGGGGMSDMHTDIADMLS